MKITGHLKFARELAVELRYQTYWLASRYFCFPNIRKGSIYVNTWFVDVYIPRALFLLGLG